MIISLTKASSGADDRYFYSITGAVHPCVPFCAVISPNRGLGTLGTQPGPEYQQCIPQFPYKQMLPCLGASLQGSAKRVCKQE